MQASRLCSVNHISAANVTCQRPCSLGRPAVVPVRRLHVAAASRQQQAASNSSSQSVRPTEPPAAPATLAQLAALWAAAAALPADAAELSGGPPASSYYVSLGLFLMTVPGGHIYQDLIPRGYACRAGSCMLGAERHGICERRPPVAPTPLPQACGPSSSGPPRPRSSARRTRWQGRQT